MKITLDYEQRTYGNEDECSNYRLEVAAHKPNASRGWLSVDMRFNELVRGRGPGNAGNVLGLHLYLSREQAARLATTILWALQQDAEKFSITHDYAVRAKA